MLAGRRKPPDPAFDARRSPHDPMVIQSSILQDPTSRTTMTPRHDGPVWRHLLRHSLRVPRGLSPPCVGEGGRRLLRTDSPSRSRLDRGQDNAKASLVWEPVTLSLPSLTWDQHSAEPDNVVPERRVVAEAVR
jgi:hypothetical protein